ncbi:uncharacterized [Tachysurus ichikawai]
MQTGEDCCLLRTFTANLCRSPLTCLSLEPEEVLINVRQDDFSQLALEMAERSNAVGGSDVLPVLLNSILFLLLQLQTRPLIALVSPLMLMPHIHTLSSDLHAAPSLGMRQMVKFTLRPSHK